MPIQTPTLGQPSIIDNVAKQTNKTLHARADMPASAFLQQLLAVAAAPVEGNPNHANVTGWPTEKPMQKIIAQKLAAAAGKAHRPL